MVVPRDGYYGLSYQVTFTSNSVLGSRLSRISINSTSQVSQRLMPTFGTQTCALSGFCVETLRANDVLQVEVKAEVSTASVGSQSLENLFTVYQIQ